MIPIPSRKYAKILRVSVELVQFIVEFEGQANKAGVVVCFVW